MADSRFENEKYVCWLKICMALLFAKEGLEKLTDKLVQTFHERLEKTFGLNTANECYSCSKDDLRRQWRKGNLQCDTNICDKWLEAIRSYLKIEEIEWNNSNISSIPKEPWECIKLYMPFGCETVKEAKEADIAAIIKLYSSNTYFLESIGNDSSLLVKVNFLIILICSNILNL
jgi:predicted metalloenzyme YecM